jgi:hypothetical protein
MESKCFIKERLMSANVLFIDENTIKTRTGISNAIDGGKQLRPMIKVAQDLFVLPALGSTLYKRLQAGIRDNDLNANETILLNNYITDCLVWSTISYLPISMGYQFYAKGALQKTSEDSSTPGKNELDYVGSYYQDIAESYKQALINYLKANYTLYAEYASPGCGWDVVQPVSMGYECPIYLGGEESCCAPTSSNTFSHPGQSFYRATGGETSFSPSPSIDGRTVILAVRSGVTRELVSTATADTNQLQRVGNVITLPTGDIAVAGERFEFIYI